MLTVIAERIEALRERSTLLERPDEVLNELAPIRQAKDGSFELDTDRAREAIREEQQILKEIFELIDAAIHETRELMQEIAVDTPLREAYESLFKTQNPT